MGESIIPVTYAVVSNSRSMDFCRAFAKGCNGRISTSQHILSRGAVAGFWLPEIYPLLKEAQKQSRTWYYGDKAYFLRDKYYRVTKNATMHDCSGDHKPDRFEKLGLTIKPWRNGSEILICPQSDTFFRLNGTTQEDWLNNVMTTLRKHTDRPIRIHYKRAGSDTERFFSRQLVNAWAVVVYSSIAGVQAVLEGVPCFALNTESSAVNFGINDLSLIENPVKPDNREQLAWALADNQWTLDEIRSGITWEVVK